MTIKRNIHNYEHFIGKVINPMCWEYDSDKYERCAITGKLYPIEDVSISSYHRFNVSKQILLENSIYCEEAECLSQEGYDIIVDKLEELGYENAYCYTLMPGDCEWELAAIARQSALKAA